MRRGTTVVNPQLVHLQVAHGVRALRLQGGALAAVAAAAAPASTWLALAAPADAADAARGGRGGQFRALRVADADGGAEAAHGAVDVSAAGAGVEVPAGVGAVRALGLRGEAAVVLGDEGCVVVGKGGEVGKVLAWREPCAAVRAFVVLEEGCVWAAEGGEGRDVVVWGEAGGVIRVGSVAMGKGVGGILRRREGRVLAELVQQVVAVAASVDGDVVLVICALGRGCCLFADEDGRTVVSEFVMDAGGGSMRHQLRVASEGPGHVAASYMRNGAFVEAQRRSGGAGGVALQVGRRADPGAAPVPTDVPIGGGGALRGLLQAIDGAATARIEALHRAAVADRRLASLNAATMFALAWKRGGDARALGMRCRVSGARPGPAVLAAMPRPWVGATAAVVVALRNEAGIALSEGWVVQLQIRDKKVSVPSGVEEGGEGTKVASQEKSGPTGLSSGGVKDGEREISPVPTPLRIFSRKIGSIPSGDTVELPFYVNVRSHAPLFVTVSLLFFRIESEDDGASAPAEAMLKIPLVMQHRLDVFDLSSPIAENSPAVDESYRLLPNARMADLIDPAGRSARPAPHQTSTRVFMPVPVSTVAQALSCGDEPCATIHGAKVRRQSALGAPFQVEVLRGTTEYSVVVTLRAPAHVLPFVRGSLCHRVAAVLQSADGSGEGGTVAADGDGSAVKETGSARGITALQLDERKILDAADEAHLQLRIAEKTLVTVHEYLRELQELGRIDHCVGGKDRAAMREVVDAVRDLYDAWRQASVHFFVSNT